MEHLVIFVLLALGTASTDKVYLRDLETGLVGMTSVWQLTTTCPNPRWNAGDNGVNGVEYIVCYSNDCILATSQYNITFVNTVFAEVSIYGAECGGPKSPKDCTANIDVGASVGNKFSTNVQTDRITTDSWRQFPSPQDHKEPVKVNGADYFYANGTVVIENKGNMYLRYLFNSRVFCGSLKNFTAYYYTCPTVTATLAKFGKYNAPSKSKVMEIYKGKCVDNAVNVGGSELIMKCTWNGTVELSGQCHCISGFEKQGKECKKCEPNKFKPNQGNGPCTLCGENSLGNHDRTSCNCLEDSHRTKEDEKNYTAKCFKLPVSPSNIKKEDVTSSSATISWSHSPGNAGNYTLSCTNCPQDDKVFPITTSAKTVDVKGLGGYAQYSLKLLFVNAITKMVGKEVSATFDLQTLKGDPGRVQDLKFKTLSDGSIELSWRTPFAKGSDSITYLITYGDSTKTTSANKFTIKSDATTRTYEVKVAAQVRVDGQLRTGQYSTFDEKITIKGGVALDLAVGIGVGAVLLVIIIALVAFFLWRKRNPPYTKVVRMEDGTVKLPGRFYNSGKLYVDPTTYNDVDEAVQEFAYEIDSKTVKIGKLLGGGEFADVYKGSLFKNGKTKDVAIKTLKPNASKRDRDDFLSEAAIIGQFTDPNVISLEGVVLKERPHKIVLEFMANGSLDKYLQTHDMQFTNLQLLGMARGVASGMKYLNELGFIHRDLAARNILVDEFRVCKVSDFGMSREIKVDETYDTQGGKIPVRWTAPESIQYKKFTTASDVWSYGILLWEIMSYGERPYWDWGNYEVLERLNQGYRLPPPMNCPKVIHDLMLHCWTKDRTKRPKMVEIRDQLEKWIRSPDLLEATASVVNKTDENLDYTVLQTVNKWLDAIGMGKYTENFIEQGFATPRQILQLTLEDLEGLGIAPIGHRKKIFKAIQNTKSQVEQRHNSMSAGQGGRKKTFSLSKKTTTA